MARTAAPSRRAPRRSAAPARRAPRAARAGRRPRRPPAPTPPAGGPPPRCSRRWGSGRPGRRRGSRRSGRRPRRRSRRRSTACTAPCPARPGSRSLVRVALTYSAAPGPRTTALPRWLTSKSPTASRTAVCSLTTPPPGYSIGISQPPKSAIFAPSARCRSCSGERLRAVWSLIGRTLASRLRRVIGRDRRADARVSTHPSPTSCEQDGNTLATVTLSTSKPATLKVDALVVGVAKKGSGFVLLPGAEEVDKAFKGRLAGDRRGARQHRAAQRGHQAVLPRRDHRAGGPRGRAWARPSSRGRKGSADVRRTRCSAARPAPPPARWPATARSGSRCPPETPRGRRGGRRGRAARGLRVPALPRHEHGAHQAAGRVVHAWSAAPAGTRPSRPPSPARTPWSRPCTSPGTGSTSRPPTCRRPTFATEAVAAAKAAGVTVEVLDEKALKKGGYGGILGVGQGSSRPPRLVQADLQGRPRRERTWRWSARASRSTPAACRSSRRRRWSG